MSVSARPENCVQEFSACFGGKGGALSNVLDIEPLRVIAKRASAKVGDDALAERFARIALERLLRDPRSLRPATPAELRKAPSWARAAIERGEELSVYHRNAALAARLNTVARRLADTRAVATADQAARPDAIADIAAARRFLAKFDRVNFDTAAHKALAFSRVLDTWRNNDDARPVCDAQSLVLLTGRIWHRVTSVAELRSVGLELRNCLARTTSNSAYGSQLARGQAQFWVLRDLEGVGLMVAMAPAPRANHFQEVKGPANARIRADHPDLVQLGIAIGVRPPPPEPPPLPPGISAAVLAARSPCRCTLCNPLHLRPPRLRRSSAAP
jgi:hypothetical protein